MIINDYGIPVKPIPSKNPQENTILEIEQQIIGNVLLIFKIQNMVLEGKNPWYNILASAMISLWAIVHTTTQYTPTQ